MKYRLQLPDVIFEIKREPQGLWDLWINGMPTLTFMSPEEAAKAVFDHATGWILWDTNTDHMAPENLTGWTAAPS